MIIISGKDWSGLLIFAKASGQYLLDLGLGNRLKLKNFQ